MSANLLTLLGNITVDSGGCPDPFISESRYPYKEGCKMIPTSTQTVQTLTLIHRYWWPQLREKPLGHHRHGLQMLRPLPPILLRKLLLLPRPSRRRSTGERGRLHPLRVSPALLRSTSRQRY